MAALEDLADLSNLTAEEKQEVFGPPANGNNAEEDAPMTESADDTEQNRKGDDVQMTNNTEDHSLQQHYGTPNIAEASQYEQQVPTTPFTAQGPETATIQVEGQGSDRRQTTTGGPFRSSQPSMQREDSPEMVAPTTMQHPFSDLTPEQALTNLQVAVGSVPHANGSYQELSDDDILANAITQYLADRSSEQEDDDMGYVDIDQTAYMGYVDIDHTAYMNGVYGHPSSASASLKSFLNVEATQPTASGNSQGTQAPTRSLFTTKYKKEAGPSTFVTEQGRQPLKGLFDHKRQSQSGAGKIFDAAHNTPAASLSRSQDSREAPASRSQRSRSPAHPEDDMDLDDPAEDSDHGWMDNLDEDDDKTSESSEELQALRTKNRNGEITSMEVLTLARLEAQRNQKKTRYNRSQRGRVVVEDHDDESMSIPEPSGLNSRDNWARTSPAREDEQFLGDSSEEKTTKLSIPAQIKDDRELAEAFQLHDRMQAEQSVPVVKKPRKKPAKDAREAHARNAEKEREKLEKQREKARKKAQKQKAGPSKATGPKKKAIAVKKGKKAAASKSKKSKKMADEAPKPKSNKVMRNFGGKDVVFEELMGNLSYADAVGDRHRQGDFGPAPVITATTKEDQLTQLLANVPDDLDIYKAKTNRTTLSNAAKFFRIQGIKATDGCWLLRGMRTPLYNHQLLASDWMIERECSDVKPYGGINADAMGLGKTIELLATMIGHPPTSEDIRNKRKATLIVVPSSVVQQWRDEIRRHVNDDIFPRVLVYKTSMDLDQIVLEDADIIVTTYSAVMRSHPYPNMDDARNLDVEDLQEWIRSEKAKAGLLHKVNWYRVVLDEAHVIKNHTSKTSVACQQLKGKYRWALIGTPMTNRVAELFPYLRFLRADFSDNFLQFISHFCDQDSDDCNNRIMVLIGIILIRRTYKDKLLGRPLVELPQTHPNLKMVRFTREEQILYRLVEQKFRDHLNYHFAAGTAGKNYSVFFVQLLRLRQLTNHPFLAEQMVKDIFTAEDMRNLKRQLKKVARNMAPLYEQLEVWLTEEVDDVQEEDQEPAGKLPFGKNDYGTFFNMDRYLAQIPEEELIAKVLCNICGDIPEDPQADDCEHVFCNDCITNSVHDQRAEGRDYAECPKCSRMMNDIRPWNDVRVRGDDDDAEEASSSKAKGKGKGRAPAIKINTVRHRRDRGGSVMTPGCDSLCWEPATKSPWLDLADQGAPLLPSSKMITIKAELLRTFEDSPTDKVLIFTQFKLSARIMARICKQEGWGFVYFLGDMSTKQRHSAVQHFHESDSVKIMIAGLKCGGIALNLTCANRVISLDLWWNHSVEQQAFGRVFRIGQKKETHFTRLVVANTVDQRMLSMQADKVRAIDRAMQDDGKPVQQLTMSELASLFGYVREDEHGNIRVEGDYDGDIDAQDVDEDEANIFYRRGVAGADSDVAMDEDGTDEYDEDEVEYGQGPGEAEAIEDIRRDIAADLADNEDRRRFKDMDVDAGMDDGEDFYGEAFDEAALEESIEVNDVDMEALQEQIDMEALQEQIDMEMSMG